VTPLTARDWGPGSVGGGAPGASPESARAIDAAREHGNGPPEEDPPPRPGCLRTLISIILVLGGAAFLVYLFGVVTDQLR